MFDRLQKRIAISKAKGIHAATLRELLVRIGDIDRFFSLSQAELHNLSGLNSEIFADEYRTELLHSFAPEVEFVRNNHIDSFFIDDPDYPRRLSNCEDAPVMLYKLGSCSLDHKHIIGIVGTRHATAYGIDITTRLVERLAEKLDSPVIVSGLAYGIDVAAHKAALANGVPTVGVLAHPLNMIYPADHRGVAARITSEGGALVTEYTTDMRIYRGNFLARNRIVAGLCDCIVVVESDFKGGSMSTAHLATQYNRDVFAVPGRVNDKYSHGTNKLIAGRTASLITCADDLISQMGWEDHTASSPAPPTLFHALSPLEEEIVGWLKDNPDSSINDICVNLNMSYAAVSEVIFKLEMDDILTTLPGGRLYLSTKI